MVYAAQGSVVEYESPAEDYVKQYNEIPEIDVYKRQVFCLQPGHYFTYENGEMKITRYFEPEFTGDSTKSFEEVVDEIEKVMKESVEMHKISDVEVASYLSSGVDSSYPVSYTHLYMGGWFLSGK